MPLSTRIAHVFVWLFCVAGIASCESKKTAPAALPGRWNLVSQHVTNSDATTGQVVTDYHLTGDAGDYLVLSASTFEEYSDNQLYFTAPYVQNGNTISMQGTTPRTDYSREIQDLTNNKLVLRHKLPTIVANQAVSIESTYSR